MPWRTRTDERPASRDGTRQQRSGMLIGDATARRPRRRVWRGTLFQRAMNPLAIRPGQGRSAFRPVDPSGPVFSSQCVRTGEPNPDGRGRKACTFFLDIPVQTIRREWWSLSGSNRRPPACKAGALPAELKPRSRSPRGARGKWWARVDSNYRPHPYQGCALTN